MDSNIVNYYVNLIKHIGFNILKYRKEGEVMVY